MKKEIPKILYLFLHSKLFYKFGRLTSKKEAISYMFEWRIPQKLRPLILEEMMILGLCIEIDKRDIEINKPEFTEEDYNKYYEELGLFNY